MRCGECCLRLNAPINVKLLGGKGGGGEAGHRRGI